MTSIEKFLVNLYLTDSKKTPEQLTDSEYEKLRYQIDKIIENDTALDMCKLVMDNKNYSTTFSDIYIAAIID